MDFWDGSGEISGQGYSRGGGDRCPDYVPLIWSDPDAVTFDASEITFKLVLDDFTPASESDWEPFGPDDWSPFDPD